MESATQRRPAQDVPVLGRKADTMTYPAICTFDAHRLARVLGQAVDRDPQTRHLGIVFCYRGVNTVLRHPHNGQSAYLVIEPTVERTPPASWTVAYGGWVCHAPPPRPEPHAELTHDAINLGIDLVVLGLGIAVLALSGGTAAPVELAVASQCAVQAALAGNDAARVYSDAYDHGALSYAEDHSPGYKVAMGAVFIYQFAAPGGIFRDVSETNAVLGDAKLGWREALTEGIGPGQRVKLGYALKLAGRSTTVRDIRIALGAKLANNILSGTLSVAQSAWGGPLADLAAAPDWIKLHFAVLHLAPRAGIRVGPAP